MPVCAHVCVCVWCIEGWGNCPVLVIEVFFLPPPFSHPPESILEFPSEEQVITLPRPPSPPTSPLSLPFLVCSLSPSAQHSTLSRSLASAYRFPFFLPWRLVAVWTECRLVTGKTGERSKSRGKCFSILSLSSSICPSSFLFLYSGSGRRSCGQFSYLKHNTWVCLTWLSSHSHHFLSLPLILSYWFCEQLSVSVPLLCHVVPFYLCSVLFTSFVSQYLLPSCPPSTALLSSFASFSPSVFLQVKCGTQRHTSVACHSVLPVRS